MPSPGAAATCVAYDDLAPSGGSGGVSRPGAERRPGSSSWRARRPSEQESSWDAPRRGAPSPLAVVRALPEGSGRATSQAAWLRAVETHPGVLRLRQDGRRGLLAVAGALARWADWQTLTSRPTWATVAAESGLVERSVARWLEWLREAGLLGVVEHGSTPQFRPMALRRESQGNRAAVYVLACVAVHGGEVSWRPTVVGAGTTGNELEGSQETVPADRGGAVRGQFVGWSEARQDASLDVSVIPSGLLLAVVSQYAREAGDRDPAPLRGVARDRRPVHGSEGVQLGAQWPMRRAARTRRDRLELCARLQRESPTLRAVGSPHRLRHLLRPLLAEQWTARGVLHALDFQPSGDPWRFAWGGSHQLRNPAGWVRYRLSAWVNADGVPRVDPVVSRDEIAQQPRTVAAPAAATPAARVASDQSRNFYLAQIRARLAARPAPERRVRRAL